GEDVWMIQRASGACFLLEPAEPIGISTQRRRQHLDRHVSSEPRITSAVDFAHPAGADQRENLVPAQPCAGSDAHVFTSAGRFSMTDKRCPKPSTSVLRVMSDVSAHSGSLIRRNRSR